jgi:hypothetical protein
VWLLGLAFVAALAAVEYLNASTLFAPSKSFDKLDLKKAKRGNILEVLLRLGCPSISQVRENKRPHSLALAALEDERGDVVIPWEKYANIQTWPTKRPTAASSWTRPTSTQSTKHCNVCTVRQ